MLSTVLLALLTSPVAPAQAPAEVERPDLAPYRAHYRAVEDELAARPTAHLTPAQRDRRQRLIQLLTAYRERGQFGLNLDRPGERLPLFVDADGRRCAVAELMYHSGEARMVESVRESDNNAWVLDLAGDEAFLAWLDTHGLTLEEAARIQLPSIGGGPSRPTFGGPTDGPGASTPAPSGPRSPRPTRPTASSPNTPGSPAGAPGAPGANTGNSGAQPLSPNPDTSAWWVWWEYNKLEWLQPNRLRLYDFPLTQGDDMSRAKDSLEIVRSTTVPTILRNLEDGDPGVRSEAAVALGRMAGDAAVDPLIELLEDRQREVRHHAILALGATGSPRAEAALISIAENGRLKSSGVELSNAARPLAVVALGLGRSLTLNNQQGFSQAVDRLAAKFAARDSDREVRTAALMVHTLAPSTEMEAVAASIAADRSEPTEVRCRAIECLRTTLNPKVISMLQDQLSGNRLELRRSAALTLGLVDHDLALAALQSAFELEAEVATRGFLLVSIARQGGPEARAFLLRELEHGKRTLAPWTALALGIVAHDQDDEGVRSALRVAGERENNGQSAAAFWIASGLAGDEAAVPTLAEKVADGGSPRMRMYASAALALIGNEPARKAMLAALPTERANLARVGIAQGLGYFGQSKDVPHITGVMDELNEPELQGLTAVAMGFHGTSYALTELGRLASAKGTKRFTRAAALDGLGLLLGRAEPLTFAQLSRQSNYALYPDWMNELLQVSL